MKITQKNLKEAMHYDPGTGVFTWLLSAGRVKAGDIVGFLRSDDYIYVQINNEQYLAHRLAFLYMTGKFPTDECDHINHVKNDNRWDNLREATNAINSRNHPMKKSNTSGFTGVCWQKTGKSWAARITVCGVVIGLGSYIDKQDAIDARKAADIKYGFHENHGTTKLHQSQ